MVEVLYTLEVTSPVHIRVQVVALLLVEVIAVLLKHLVASLDDLFEGIGPLLNFGKNVLGFAIQDL